MTTLSQKQLNFARFSIVCVNIIKLPLIDILNIFIKPAHLCKQIKRCQSLIAGDYKLNQDQKTKCCYYSSVFPDYNTFDVTLLYKLIRNLCPSLEPKNKWGNKPTNKDLSVGDDIERIRELRNAIFAHTESAEISEDDFKELWKDAKYLIQRCQQFTTSKGCKTDYNQMIVDLERKAFTFDEYISWRERSGAIYILGDPRVLCGETACFEAEITLEQDVDLPVSWDRVDRLFRKQLDIKSEKHKGSNSRQLFIHCVCKGDEAGYQAVISRNQDVKIFSNEVYLRPYGEPPCLGELNVTSQKEKIYIHYVFNVLEDSPKVKEIRWTKNSLTLDLSNNKYSGRKLADKCITISSPDEEDKGEYTCIVSNAAGSDSKSVKLDIPSAKILSTTQVVFGSDAKLDCLVSGHPPPNKVKWQNSLDGTTFNPIDIYKDKYFGSSTDPCSPFLLVRKATLNDQQYYQVDVWNAIGKCTSNRVFLQVTGDRPNMSEGTCTLQGHSVKLRCDVFLYDDSPALTDVYWTKGGIKLDIATHEGKYLGVNLTDPSLTINNVNFNDAGDYQLIAVNAVGETRSEVIVLGVPEVRLEKYDKKDDGSLWFTMTIKSVPAPHTVKWNIKENDSENFQPINVNAVEYKGTTNNLPHPVLVIKHSEKLNNCSFEIEVKNRIGEGNLMISGKISQDIQEKKQKTIGKFHTDGGARVPFTKLLNELAEEFPKEKNSQLKNLIQLSYEIKEDNKEELNKANTALDCFMILWKEEIITLSDVIAMQFLLKETKCEELEKKCVEYAKNRKALYYYEKPPENGFKNVRFHVDATSHHFTTEDEAKIKETVANIVGCSIEDVRVNGYLHSSSFFIVLSIKEIYIEKLFNIKQHDKDKLSKLNIDYFIDDFHTVSLKGTTEGSTESSKEYCIVDKGQKKSKPTDEQSRKQAIDTRAMASRYLEEAINRSTSRKRHARGKRYVENEMFPILNPPLVSCMADSARTPKTLTVRYGADEQTSTSFPSASLIVIPKVTKLDEKSRKQAMDTRPTEVGYVAFTMNRYTSKERHAREIEIVENEMVPIPDLSLVSCVTDTLLTPKAAEGKDVIDERKTNNYSPGRIDVLEKIKVPLHVKERIDVLEKTKVPLHVKERIDVLEKTKVPLHVKVKCDRQISEWKDDEKVFLETHSFKAMLKKVRDQPYVTFVGAPGSGKTATARHIALILQQEGYQCLPITESSKIQEYCDPENPQVFVIDDVVGFWGFDLNSFFTLTRYKETLINPLMPKTKVLMTCREVVYRNKQASNTFLTKEENVVFLQSTENALNENDKRELLSRYQLGTDFLCKADLGSTSNMLPLLCKLYLTKDEYSGYGPSFFISPVPCLLKALDEMKARNVIHYASLVLLMAWQGPLPIDLLEDSKSPKKKQFEGKKCKFLKACEVSSFTENFIFVNALSEMEGTYTVKNDQQINFIHDSMFEIIAYHFGRQFPEVILENLNNEYIANYIKIDTSSSRKRKRDSEEETDQTVEESDSVTKHKSVNDLCIKLKESQCPMLAKYWYNDLGAGDLFSAFGNVSLKHPYVFQPFIRMIEDEPYFMFHSVFLENIGKKNIFTTGLDSLERNFTPNDAHALLTGCMLINKKAVLSVKAISFVIYYGHHQILQCIIDRVFREKGSLDDLFENEYTKSSRLHYHIVPDSDINEPDRDVDGDDHYSKTVVDRGNESDFDSDANASADTNSEMDDNDEDCKDPDSNTDVTDSDCDTDSDSETAIYWKPVSIEQIRLLCLGCHSGDLTTVQILLRHVNKNELNITDNICKANNPLAIAIKLGHLKIAMELLKIRADVNSNIFEYSPLIGACKYGHISIVEELIKNGDDVNLRCKSLNRGCITPLIIACQRGQLRVVEELIKLGADVNLAGKETPLTAACLNGHFDIVEILLKAGADINLGNGEKKTPLEIARERGHVDAFNKLTGVIYSRV